MAFFLVVALPALPQTYTKLVPARDPEKLNLGDIRDLDSEPVSARKGQEQTRRNWIQVTLLITQGWILSINCGYQRAHIKHARQNTFWLIKLIITDFFSHVLLHHPWRLVITHLIFIWSSVILRVSELVDSDHGAIHKRRVWWEHRIGWEMETVGQ